jgi:hypothetical protein
VNSIFIPLAIDENGQPLPVEKQIAVALVSGTGKDIRIKMAHLLGWPLTLIKYERSGGYIIFDQTLNLFTSLQFTVLQNYSIILNTLQNTKSDEELLKILRSFKWADIKGYEEVIFKGLVNIDLSRLFSTGSQQLPLSILPKEATQFDIDSLISDLNSKEENIQNNLNILDNVTSKISTIITILKGKRAEERKQIEDKYDQIISQKQNELQQKSVEVKKNLESELLQEAKKSYERVAEIENSLAKAEIDLEAGLITQKDLEALNITKSRYLQDVQQRLQSIKQKYKIEIKRIVDEINKIKQQKQVEVEAKNKEIGELDNLLNYILKQLNDLKGKLKAELENLKSVSKRAPFIEDKIDVILPFLVLRDSYDRFIVVPPSLYRNKRSLFGFFKRDPTDITSKIMDFSPFEKVIITTYTTTLNDNLLQLKAQVEKGLEDLYNDGWNVRRQLESYYIL